MMTLVAIDSVLQRAFLSLQVQEKPRLPST